MNRIIDLTRVQVPAPDSRTDAAQGPGDAAFAETLASAADQKKAWPPRRERRRDEEAAAWSAAQPGSLPAAFVATPDNAIRTGAVAAFDGTPLTSPDAPHAAGAAQPTAAAPMAAPIIDTEAADSEPAPVMTAPGTDSAPADAALIALLAGKNLDDSSDREVGAAASDDGDDDDEPDGASGRFGETLFAHVAEAAQELSRNDAALDPGAQVIHHPEAGSHGGGSGDAQLHHAHLGATQAELVFGEGSDRIALTVALDRMGVHVHAQVASGNTAAALLGATDELRRALGRHGLALAGFSTSHGGAGGGGQGGRQRGDTAQKGTVPAGNDARATRPDVRVIV